MEILLKSLAITIGIIFILGWIGVQYTQTIGKAQTNAEREVFKETTAYTEAAAEFLSDSLRQYNQTDDETEKTAIMEYVVMHYPNLDTSAIANDKLRQFYNQCFN